MEKNIETLVLKAKQNDEQSQIELVEISYKKAYFISYNIVKNEEIAKDIVQEAYITAFQKLDQLKENTKFESWFMKIVNNKTIDYLRSKEGKNRELSFSSLNDEENGINFEENIENDYIDWKPEENINYALLKEGVQNVLDSLPDNQRLALIMYYFEEQTIGEIASSFNVSQNTVKSYLSYGRNKIKECIETMRKKGTSFYGVAPIPFLLWMFETESQKIQALGMQEVIKVVSSTTSTLVATAAVETSKQGSKGFAKWWAAKSTGVKASVCVASTAVVGGGIYVTNATETVIFQQEVPGIYTYSNTVEVGLGCYLSIPEQTYTFTYSKSNNKIISIEVQEKANIYELENSYRYMGVPDAGSPIQLTDYSQEAVENRDKTYDRNYLDYQETIDNDGNWMKVEIYDVNTYVKEFGDEPLNVGIMNLNDIYQESSNAYIYDENVIMSQIEDMPTLKHLQNDPIANACYSGMHKDYKKSGKK